MTTATLTRIRFRPEVEEFEGRYTAFCRELGVAAGGSSISESVASLRATVRIYCDIMARRGTLDNVLAKSGILSEPVSVEKTDDEVVMEISAG